MVSKNYSSNLVGDLDSLKRYSDKLVIIKDSYLEALANLVDPKKEDAPKAYGIMYNKASIAISDYEKVVQIALKNKEDVLATGIPEIDGLNSRLSPSIKIAGEFHLDKRIDLSGNIFIGNNLNDQMNTQVIYNPNSSTYGINLNGKVNLFGFDDNNILVVGNMRATFSEKSLFRDSTSSLSFNLIDAKMGLEVIFYKGFSFYYGRNYNQPLNNVEDFKKEVNFKSDDTENTMVQAYTNWGFRGQYSFTEKKEYSLAFDINAISLDQDLKSTLETTDPYLLILKLSLTKSLF
jgi:hypothetical protein